MHHLAVADVHAHVADRAVEEHQVAGLQLAARRPACPSATGWLLECGRLDPGRGVGVLREAGAVERVRTGGAPDVGVADLGQRGVDRRLRGAAGRATTAARAPPATVAGVRRDDLLLLRRRVSASYWRW